MIHFDKFKTNALDHFEEIHPEVNEILLMESRLDVVADEIASKAVFEYHHHIDSGEDEFIAQEHARGAVIRLCDELAENYKS
jgi:hypothetical protein